MNIQKDWKAKLESAYSFMLKFSKITVCLTHTICKNSIPGEMGMNIDKDHVRRRIRQTLKDKEIDRPGNLTRDTCQI